MYNFLKSIFGIPRDDDRESRNFDFFKRDGDFSNEEENDRWGPNDGSDGDDIFRHFESSMNRFGFPLFGDLFEMHKYIDGLMVEMERKMGSFDFSNQSGIMWKGDNFGIYAHADEPSGNTGSLRDSYLKKSENPIAIENAIREDVNLDGRVKMEDIENVLRNKSETNPSRNLTMTQPNVYSKSVYVRIIRRPDGSTEIIQKTNDNTGKEETTITKDNSVLDPLQPSSIYPLIPSEDRAGRSIFKKFFPF